MAYRFLTGVDVRDLRNLKRHLTENVVGAESKAIRHFLYVAVSGVRDLQFNSAREQEVYGRVSCQLVEDDLTTLVLFMDHTLSQTRKPIL